MKKRMKIDGKVYQVQIMKKLSFEHRSESSKLILYHYLHHHNLYGLGTLIMTILRVMQPV